MRDTEQARNWRRLRSQGFQKLRTGRIHFRCPQCGRKESNNRRHDDHDPPNAVLMEIACDKCAAGCKGDDPTYFNARGREIDYWRWWDRRERARAALAADSPEPEVT